MSTSDKKFVDEYIKRNIAIGRAVEGQANKIAQDMGKLHSEILAEVKKQYPNLTGRNLSKLNKEIAQRVVEIYEAKILPEVDSVVTSLVEKESAWVATSLQIYPAVKSAKLVNSASIAAAASKKTFQGHTFSFWFKKAGNNLHKKAVSILETAFIHGATTEEAVTQISAFLNKNKSDIRTLARSYFNHAAVESREKSLAANADIIEGYVWVSVLDNRTTPLICGVRDGLLYNQKKEPVGHSLEWGAGPGRMHFNCRSTYIPKVIGSVDIRELVRRPAISAGSNYEPGSKFNRTGTVRKATATNREKGIYNVKQVKATTDYESWLRTNKTSFIADALGNKELAKEFKAGNINLLDVVKRGQPGDINRL